MTHYGLFGLHAASEIGLHGPRRLSPGEADVEIRLGEVKDEPSRYGAEETLLNIPEIGRFFIRAGREIVVSPRAGVAPQTLSVYLLGSAMGAVLHQRGLLLLHGSCVTRDGLGLLIMGESGAGKSTMARAFLEAGWKLVTDDVSAVTMRAGKPVLQSSYPSQKLWKDAMERHALSGQPLYQLERREKFSVNAETVFFEGQCPLTHAVVLRLGDEAQVTPFEGFAKVDQLLRNTYRAYMIPPERRQRHFQACIDLGKQLSMALAVRREGEEDTKRNCALLLANMMGETKQ